MAIIISHFDARNGKKKNKKVNEILFTGEKGRNRLNTKHETKFN